MNALQMKQRSRNSKQIRRRNEIALSNQKNRHGGAQRQQPNTHKVNCVMRGETLQNAGALPDRLPAHRLVPSTFREREHMSNDAGSRRVPPRAVLTLVATVAGKTCTHPAAAPSSGSAVRDQQEVYQRSRTARTLAATLSLGPRAWTSWTCRDTVRGHSAGTHSRENNSRNSVRS